MNRGSLQGGHPSMLGVRASMRPRFMNRGSAEENLRRRKKICRFNEAPIHESGKCSPPRTRIETHERFNEAPIHESGK